MRTRTVFALAALTAAALAARQGFSLRWTPKEGDEIKYRTVGEMTVTGQQATITAVNTQKVIRVDPDGGYLVQATPTEGKASFAGNEMAMRGPTVLSSYLPDGSLKEIQSDRPDATAYRMANLTSFHAPTKPVAIGEGWTAEGKADPKTGAVAWRADYKVVGEETIGPFAAIKMDVKTRETEGSEAGSATGSVWVGKDGIVVRNELTWTNVAVPGAPGPVNGKLTMTRIE